MTAWLGAAALSAFAAGAVAVEGGREGGIYHQGLSCLSPAVPVVPAAAGRASARTAR